MLDKIENNEKVLLKLRYRNKSNKKLYKAPVSFTRKDTRLWLSFDFNRDLSDELKVCLSHMKWHGYDEKPVKQWSCRYDEHTLFQLNNLAGNDPYFVYTQPPKEFSPHYLKLKKHQLEGIGSALNTHRALWAYEMGLGKTLMAFELALQLNIPEIWWVSTRSALLSVKIQANEWNFKIPIRYLTYEGLRNLIANWGGEKAPMMIVGDESHKLKNYMSQRSQAFSHVTKSMRDEYGDKAVIILMTGTPSPKSPIDWYSQCQIVQPGFIKEADIHKFKNRLAVTKQSDKGNFLELLSWRDNPEKCDFCGKLKDDFDHDFSSLDYHAFIPSENEVERLYIRMKGLVTVKTKKQCTDLPEKIYQKIYCKPTTKTNQAMKLIATRTVGAVKTLMALRELSDGFQYSLDEEGTTTCPTCKGTKLLSYPLYIGPDKTEEFIKSIDEFYDINIPPESYIIDPVKFPQYFKLSEEQNCPACEGTGAVKKYVKGTHLLTTTKDKALIDLLDEYEDVGRIVIYSGFTASVEKLCDLVRKQGWEYIKLDGNGFRSTFDGDRESILEKFQTPKTNTNKIAFIGNPGSSSTGLTLTASPVVVFYSNSFNGDDRQQAEDRIHRLGMDENRGAKIIDLIHLPTDEYVYDNLQKKKTLQDMSMGLLLEYMNKERDGYDYADV